MSDDLSRLLDDELPAEEAEALRERIATDPEVAAKWARMRTLGREMRALPREMPRPRRRSVAPWLGWAAAAALALWMLRPAPVRVLTAGTELVEGRAAVLAGDVVVDVDGKVSIVVEPPGGRARGAGAEVTAMDKKSIAGALAGSVVTVTVLQGVAWMRPADAAAVEVRAGETRSVGHAREVGVGAPVTTRVDEDADPRVGELEKELDRVKLEKALIAGQLRRHEGVPQAWPADLPAPLRPEGFEAFLRQRVAAVPDTEVVAVDCEEYPCVAIVRSRSTADDWQDKLMPLHDDLEGAGFGDDLHVVGRGSHRQTDTSDVRLYGFAITTGDEDPDLEHRVAYRTESAVEDAAAELTEP